MSKYLIVSGCSYGEFAHDIRTTFKRNGLEIKNDEDLIVLDIHSQSQSANYISDSIIHTVDTLVVDNGISPEDIFVVSEWTEFSRISFRLPTYIDNNLVKNLEDTSTLNGTCKISNSNPPLSPLDGDFFEKIGLSNFKIKWVDRQPMIPSIDESIYYVPLHVDFNDYKKYNCDVIIKKAQELHRNLDYEFLINNWFDSVLKTQFYLENMGVCYKFCSMNGEFISHRISEDKFIYDNKESLCYYCDKNVINTVENFK